ncbi:MAG TPA: SDR family NAD(P)-dependent oxidoreductase [Jatrophihabitantaceae bacterium]|jgi:NAD(P)-dependent dehydrogenase (short-subunit alcohol dehydrogenase family)
MNDLDGRVAVITGGGGTHSIGRATGKLFAEQGGRVVLADINAKALEQTVAELASAGLDVAGIPTDVAEYDSVHALADAVFERYGRVDIAFLNAGIAGAGDLFAVDLDGWHRLLGVNLYGILHGIKAFLPRMDAQATPGHILGTSSGAGVVGLNYQAAAYAVTKQAVCTLMECLYGQLRDRGSRIKAHVVLPPLTKTNLAGDPNVMLHVEQALKAGGADVVLAEPGEVAATVLDAIRTGNFWAYHDHETDKRLYNGKFAAAIDWEDRMARARADALLNRSALDPYLWG